MTAAKPTPRHRPKHTLNDMSEPMRTLLIHSASRGVHPKEIDAGARWTQPTLKALKAHGLIHLSTNSKGRDLWRATDTGRHVVSAHTPRLLAARPGTLRFETLPVRPGKKKGRHAVDEQATGDGDYTDIPAFGMKEEPEAA